MAKLKPITEAEWPLLVSLWRKSPLSAREIYDSLTSERELHIQTVRTLLDRMAGKGVLQREKVHGIYVFFPIVGREECVEHQSQSFLDRFFEGKPAEVATYFLRDASLPREELERLQAMINEKMQECDEEEKNDA